MSGGGLGPTPRPPGGAPGAPLAGVRVGVTSGRRGEELVGSLTRLGARVLWAPTVEIVAVPTAALERQTAVALSPLFG
jgi:hypothetical protein